MLGLTDCIEIESRFAALIETDAVAETCSKLAVMFTGTSVPVLVAVVCFGVTRPVPVTVACCAEELLQVTTLVMS